MQPWQRVPIVSRVYEATETSGVTDDDLASFRRLTGEDRPDALDPETRSRFTRLAAYLYYANPLARRLCDITTDMVLGGGVNIESEKSDPEDTEAAPVRDLVKRFLNHPANEFQIRLPSLFTSLNAIYGELFIPVFVSPANGDVSLGFLEHHLVRDVMWNKANRQEAMAVIQRPPGAARKPLWWNVIRAKQGGEAVEYPAHPVFGGDAPAMPSNIVGFAENPVANYGEEYEYGGELLYFRTNVIGTGRGRSALEPALDWLHAYDQFLFGDLRNANLQAAFVWDVEIQGADGNQLRRRADEVRKQPPRPGEVNFHNEKEKWQALSPNLQSASHSELGSQVKRIIGLALGIPSHLVGAEAHVNRTTAGQSDIPLLRKMEQRQTLLVYMLRTILDYMLDQKRYAGILSTARQPYPYRVVPPPLTAGEVVAMAESLYNITSALVAATGVGLTSLSDARRVWYAYGVGEQSVPADIDETISEERSAGLLLPPGGAAPASGGASGGGLVNPNGAPSPAANGNGNSVPGRVKRSNAGMGGPGKVQRGQG